MLPADIMKTILGIVLCTCASYVGTKQIHVERMLSGLSMPYETYPVPKLPYKYDAYEPWFDAKTVEAHHEQVHKERAFQMNRLLKEWRKSNSTPELSKLSLFGILENIDKVPQKWRDGLRNNIGGYVNHLFFYAVLSPNPKGEERNLSKVMHGVFKRSFVNKTNFMKMFNNTASEVFGNGYVWMARVPKQRYMTIFTALEERNPISMGMQPLLGVDLWEHAYWSKYGNNREEYIRNWWKLVDFDKVENVLDWWWARDPYDPKFHEDL